MPETALQKTNVTLKMLIESGILAAGSKLTAVNPNVSGYLNSDGSIQIFFNCIEKSFPFPSGAARYIEKRSINGWIYFQIETKDGKINLSYFRDKYVEAKTQKG